MQHQTRQLETRALGRELLKTTSIILAALCFTATLRVTAFHLSFGHRLRKFPHAHKATDINSNGELERKKRDQKINILEQLSSRSTRPS